MNWWQDDRWSRSKGWQDRRWKSNWTWESSSWTEAPRQVYDAVYDAIATGDMEEVQAACSSAQSSRGRRLSRGRGGKSQGKGKRKGKSSAASSSAEMRGDAPQPAPKRSAAEQQRRNRRRRSSTRTAEADERCGTIRVFVNLEEKIRKCDCPPWDPHDRTCPDRGMRVTLAMAEDLLRLQAIQELKEEGRGEWAYDPLVAVRAPDEPGGPPRRRVKKRPARAISAPPVPHDDRAISDQYRKSRSSQKWEGPASVSVETAERSKHSTDAWISPRRIPAECFRGGADFRDLWCKKFTDERGQDRKSVV